MKYHFYNKSNWIISGKILKLYAKQQLQIKFFNIQLYHFNFIMIKAASQGQTIQYISYKNLSQPSLDTINIKNILEDFESKEWRKNFDAITHLREANKFYGTILLQQLLPQVYKHIIAQIQNLRSNNSKQALTLVTEIFDFQNIEKLDKSTLCPLVAALFNKTTCQKAFLKKEALNAVECLPKKYNPYLLHQITNQILSINSQISELAVKILYLYIESNKISEVDGDFLGILIRTINGKRAVLQKKGREILVNLKQRVGQEKLTEIAELARKESQITDDQMRALLLEIKKQEKQVKSQQSLKDYIMMKKKSDISA